MASRLLKCYGTCNEKYEIDFLIKHKGKNYCKSCLEKMMKERADREELYQTIKDLYNVTYPTGMMLKQIKQYKEINNYSYKSMTLTLQYCSKQPGMKFVSTMGVGIIPHQYERAKADYIERMNRENSYFNVEVKPITIKIAKIDNVNRLKSERLINLEELLDD